jgi:hypothetical protein
MFCDFVTCQYKGTHISLLYARLWNITNRNTNMIKDFQIGQNLKQKIWYILLLICNTSLIYSQDASSIFNKVKTAVFKIEILDDSDQVFQIGTGFFISPDGIGISNFHVFEGAKKARIVTYDGKVYNIISTVSWDKNSDLLKFKIERPKGKTFNFIAQETRTVKIGEKVYAIGNPKGLNFSLSDGIVSSKRNIENIGEIIQTTVPISSGNSGSPLINMNGKFIGIISFSIKDAQNLNFAIHANEINKLIPVDLYIFPSKKTNEDLPKKEEKPSETINDAKSSHLELCDFWKSHIDLDKAMGKGKVITKYLNSTKNDGIRKTSTISPYKSKDWFVTSVAVVEAENVTSVVTLGISNDYNTNTKVYVLYSIVNNGRPEHLIDGYYKPEYLQTNDNSKMDMVEIPVDGFKLRVFIYEGIYMPGFSYVIGESYTEVFQLDQYEFH